MAESEVARIRQQITLEYQAAQNGLIGLSTGILSAIVITLSKYAGLADSSSLRSSECFVDTSL